MKTVLTLEFNSLFIVATAAIHGVYSKVNVRKLRAVKGVNKLPRDKFKLATFVPNKTLIVLITASFAINPLIRDVATLQSPKPIGRKIGAITFPIIANILWELSETTLNLVSKVCKKQMNFQDTPMPVLNFCYSSMQHFQILD